MTVIVAASSMDGREWAKATFGKDRIHSLSPTQILFIENPRFPNNVRNWRIVSSYNEIRRLEQICKARGHKYPAVFCTRNASEELIEEAIERLFAGD